MTAGLSLDDVQGSNTSVYVGCIAQEYDSLYAYDEEINAKYAGMFSIFFLIVVTLSMHGHLP